MKNGTRFCKLARIYVEKVCSKYGIEKPRELLDENDIDGVRDYMVNKLNNPELAKMGGYPTDVEYFISQEFLSDYDVYVL